MSDVKEKKEDEVLDVLAGVVDNESKTYTFEKEVSIGCEKKKGSFTAKYFGVAGRLRLGTLRAKLLEGAPQDSIDEVTNDIAYMMAYLKIALIKTPSWWNMEELDDISDLTAVYLEVFKFIQFFREKDE